MDARDYELLRMYRLIDRVLILSAVVFIILACVAAYIGSWLFIPVHLYGLVMVLLHKRLMRLLRRNQ